MSTSATTPRTTREAKVDARRDELAESALVTLGERGYARTSLREIAQNSPYSHGVVHYYFDNKVELITYCVRYYKAQCATRYDELVATSTTADELLGRFADKLVETLTDEPQMHRLWYDLRTQAMFEESLREAVLEIDHSLELMIWRVVSRFAELAGARPALDRGTAYALLDGVFEKALLEHLTGTGAALESLRERALTLMPSLISS
ncbi:TetR/AcrR family transcriptional regulator [Nocardioides currus]|uniref:TetR family transcriptional regulator n=1 Tax=Nocardioides currus TaxID=2133958 RepID=A0A2R7Z0S5_9ACTN|nr:TetR/AcrR family transcriptional regulator [Nocardioides currus]PUA82237.1 TetR family transcriptional regulator [Nocardioides currus]